MPSYTVHFDQILDNHGSALDYHRTMPVPAVDSEAEAIAAVKKSLQYHNFYAKECVPRKRKSPGSVISNGFAAQ